jgi:hypothetical protein
MPSHLDGFCRSLASVGSVMSLPALVQSSPLVMSIVVEFSARDSSLRFAAGFGATMTAAARTTADSAAACVRTVSQRCANACAHLCHAQRHLHSMQTPRTRLHLFEQLVCRLHHTLSDRARTSARTSTRTPAVRVSPLSVRVARRPNASSRAPSHCGSPTRLTRVTVHYCGCAQLACDTGNIRTSSSSAACTV